MSTLHLDFLGCRARLRCEDAGVLDGLRRDFEHFETPPRPGPAVELELRVERPGRWADGGLPLFRGPGFTALSQDGRRLVRYADGAAGLYDYRTRRGVLACRNPARLHELAYLLLLSRCGEALDRRGLHRVHALGMTFRGQGFLLLLPSGGGKSTLALKLLRRPGFRLLSEDTPLVDGDGELRSFPLRLGFKAGADLQEVPAELRRPFERLGRGPKTVVDLPYFRDRLAAPAAPRWLLLGERGPGAPSLRPASKVDAAASLGLNLVVGWGVAQMTEWMARPTPSGVWGLAKVAAARSRASFSLLRRAESWRFDLGGEPAAAAAALEDFLASSS